MGGMGGIGLGGGGGGMMGGAFGGLGGALGFSGGGTGVCGGIVPSGQWSASGLAAVGGVGLNSPARKRPSLQVRLVLSFL